MLVSGPTARPELQRPYLEVMRFAAMSPKILGLIAVSGTTFSLNDKVIELNQGLARAPSRDSGAAGATWGSLGNI